MTMKKKAKKSRKTLLLIILLLLAVGITVVAITVTVINSGKSTSSAAPLVNNGSAISGVYRGKSSAELLKELKKQQVRVTDKISSQIIFPSGNQGTKGAWIVENSPANSVTEQCSVVLNGQAVALSTPIKPGQHIENITLNTPVSPGTYSVTVNIKYFDPQTSAYRGQADYQNVRMVVS
jgi:cell division protein YceG involved in septum cleavage